jgi:molybdopterin-guanine dinucleotide biosynthesis protein B
VKVYGVIGWKNAGKTGLMERLVAEITRRGLSVSTVKHVHHDVDLDQPGKDTFRHRAAGAREVVLASARRHAILTEHRGPEPELAAILARLAPVDLVLVEGYKRDAHPKIEVFREATGQALIQPGDPMIRAIATDAALPDQAVPVLDLNDTAGIADFVLRETGLLPDPATLFDTVVVVDWSSSGTPSPARPSADAIWIGVAQAGGVTAHYLRTRADAERMLTGLLDTEAAAGQARGEPRRIAEGKVEPRQHAPPGCRFGVQQAGQHPFGIGAGAQVMRRDAARLRDADPDGIGRGAGG